MNTLKIYSHFTLMESAIHANTINLLSRRGACWLEETGYLDTCTSCASPQLMSTQDILEMNVEGNQFTRFWHFLFLKDGKFSRAQVISVVAFLSSDIQHASTYFCLPSFWICCSENSDYKALNITENLIFFRNLN